MKTATARRRRACPNGTFLGAAEIKAMRVVPELVFVNCCHLAAMSRSALLRGLPAASTIARAFASNVAAGADRDRRPLRDCGGLGGGRRSGQRVCDGVLRRAAQRAAVHRCRGRARGARRSSSMAIRGRPISATATPTGSCGGKVPGRTRPIGPIRTSSTTSARSRCWSLRSRTWRCSPRSRATTPPISARACSISTIAGAGCAGRRRRMWRNALPWRTPRRTTWPARCAGTKRRSTRAKAMSPSGCWSR